MQRSAPLQRNRLIDLNILPAELRPHHYPRWYVLGLAAVLTGCVLLVPMVTLQHSAAQETAHLRDQLALVTGQLQGVETDIGKGRGLHAEIAQSEQALAELQAERASLPGAGGPLAQDLSLLYSAAPPGVRIDTTSRSEKTVTTTGEASSIESIIAYAKALTESGSFSDVTITKASAGGTGLEFAVQVAQ
jgi:Tfp pilus assembly protein PilN